MDLRSIELRIRPLGLDGDRRRGFAVRYRLDSVAVSAGEPVLEMPSRITSVETMRPHRLMLTDDHGDVELVRCEVDGDATTDFRRWTASRDVAGTLEVTYDIPVRPVNERTPSAPLYDLRSEGNAINGVGITFLALPPVDGNCDVSIRWILPAGPWRAVTSWGEGSQRVNATLEALRYAHFSVGALRSFPEQGDPSLSEFGLYWSSEPLFDPEAVATYVRSVYRSMAEFFREQEPGFRVFARKHPYKGNGGCGLTRSFIFGYCEQLPQSDESLRSLLAHETVHNWVRLDGDKSEQSWYSEGLADYYALVLPYRAELISSEQFLRQLNDLSENYYANPLQTLPFKAATELFWSDMRAQRVPYGRGFHYFLDLQHRLRSAGANLDELVVRVLERQRSGEAVDTQAWLATVAEALGPDAYDLHVDMLSGKIQWPAPDALGPEIVGHRESVRTLEVGFATASMRPGQRITDVVPGSAAQQAGVRNGDEVVACTSFAELEASTHRTVHLAVRRSADSPVEELAYVAVGPTVPAMRWALTQHAEGVPNHGMRFH